jgi:hypothetical protein
MLASDLIKLAHPAFCSCGTSAPEVVSGMFCSQPQGPVDQKMEKERNNVGVSNPMRRKGVARDRGERRSESTFLLLTTPPTGSGRGRGSTRMMVTDPLSERSEGILTCFFLCHCVEDG